MGVVSFIDETVIEDTREQKEICFPLKSSLFPNVPPTIYFVMLSEPTLNLPVEIRNKLQWKLSPITPKLIRDTVTHSGYNMTESENNWTSIWGKYMKCSQFDLLKETQKVNHFPGSFCLGRKDKLWVNYVKMQEKHGKKEFSYMPDTFILPEDLNKLQSLWQSDDNKKWIIKPPASARGLGINVINEWSQIPKDVPIIVQKYICNPYLINETKFDIRLYVLVTSLNPLKIYIFNDGLVRFASVKYSESLNSLGQKFIHLTNYSVNRENSSYIRNEDKNICNGHKWTLKVLWKYLQKKQVDVKELWSDIKDIVNKTLISCENFISRLLKAHTKSRYSCYELFGFDILLDSNLKLWLLEVNISPSLHSNSKLDETIKSQLIKDMLNTVGFQIPNDVEFSLELQRKVLKTCNISTESTATLFNMDIHRTLLSQTERIKHIRYKQQNWSDNSILKDITRDDLRQLIESEDELLRCGNFLRIFPSRSSSVYLKYFEDSKYMYYNLLLDAWEQRYCKERTNGIELLKSLCKEGKHL